MNSSLMPTSVNLPPRAPEPLDVTLWAGRHLLSHSRYPEWCQHNAAKFAVMQRPARTLLVAITAMLVATGTAIAVIVHDEKSDEKYEQAVADERDEPTIQLIRLLADQGDADAQHGLGLMYTYRNDYTEATNWYRKAADRGKSDAQYDLGVMYASGKGVPQDYVQAHMWLSLAATNAALKTEDRDLALTFRDNLVTRQMTPAQIAEAQKLASEWNPR
jgi:uncharacterized protein